MKRGNTMYKRYGVLLLLLQGMLFAALVSVKGIQINRIAAMPAFQTRFIEDFQNVEQTSFAGMVKSAASGQRVVDYKVLIQEERLEEVDYEALLRIVEAEAGSEDIKGRILVANVVLNRVENKAFPDTVKEVVLQKEKGVYQFSPVGNGRFYKVLISDQTREAVERALAGEDYSQGALYFAARKYADPARMKWFDIHLTRLFTYGGHEFFA